ncbi:uncharacterized protein LOC126620726 [Malus sylvestris]|uniref:uncharacterized protein LOC126620726 n=1 Tax=Malus sylvestris TaxID=3752 RepID=UPI0021ACF65E|nr:uncharacterized protein LOC126620726 [Malus sylvestris]
MHINEMASQQLPRTLALKYKNKYLRYIHQDVENLHGVLQFSGDDIVSPYTKLHVEPAANGGNNGGLGLVHIRSAYNNKYLRRADEVHWWIVAGADEPVEYKSLWSCTLWEPQVVGVDSNNNKVLLRLLHVQLGHYAMPLSANAFHSCLFAYQKNPDTRTNEDVFSVTDWESLVIFPKFVAFKGDNGHYLTPKSINRNPHLQFSASGLIDPSVGHEVFTAGDGSVRIKPTHARNFWRRSRTNDWIWTDTEDATNKDSDTLFWPVKLEAADHNNTDNINVVALRNLGNNKYSKRFTTGSKTISCLCANVPTITVEAHLAVEEPVLSRKISDIGFRLTDARIYDKSDVVVATGKAENRTKEPTNEIIRLVYLDTSASTWNSVVDPVSFSSLIPTTIISATLFIVDEKDNVEVVGDQFTGVYEWGKARTSQTTIVKEFPVVVKPMTRVKVSLIATRGSCDVPFFYTQKDSLVSIENKMVPYSKEGGVYTGVCFYNLKHKEEEEPL